MGEKARNITKKKVKTPVLRALTTKDTGEQIEFNSLRGKRLWGAATKVVLREKIHISLNF